MKKMYRDGSQIDFYKWLIITVNWLVTVVRKWKRDYQCIVSEGEETTIESESGVEENNNKTGSSVELISPRSKETSGSVIRKQLSKADNVDEEEITEENEPGIARNAKTL